MRYIGDRAGLIGRIRPHPPRLCSVREEGVMSLWRGISARSLRLVMAVFILGETQQILSQQFESVGFL